MIEPDKFYTNSEVAEILNIKPSLLKKWRHIKKFNTTYYKFGVGVRYQGCDLIKWIEANKK